MFLACVLFKHFPFQVEAEAEPHLKGRAVLLVHREGKTPTVLDTSPAIDGITPGTPLAEAAGRYPVALQREANPALYQRRFEEVIQVLEGVSPVVEESGTGCAYVSLEGIEDLYGGLAGLLKALQDALPPRLEGRIGIGPARFPAAMAASAAGPGQILRAPPDLQAFLAPYPVDVLPVAWEVTNRLKRLGVRTLGDLGRQRIGPLQAQFGPLGTCLWEMARGIDHRPLLSRRHEEQFEASVDFPVPTVSLEAISLAAENLLVRLFGRPQLRGRYARLAVLRARISRRPVWERRIAFKEAAGSAAVALRMVKHAVSLHPPPGPVEDLSVTLQGITGEAGRQGSLWTEVRRQDQMRETLRQLEARLGVRPPIYQFRDAEPWSRIPERRRVLIELSL